MSGDITDQKHLPVDGKLMEEDKAIKYTDATYVLDADGKYLAYVNAGLTNEQAYELITIEAKREHELTIAEKQLELERIKVEAQMRAGGIKQLLNR